MTYRKWELLSEMRPAEPGEYWVAVMEYPVELSPSRIRMYGVQALPNKGGVFAIETDHPSDQIVWWGPLDAPEFPRDAEKRLRKEQGSAFSRRHEKVCCHCGDKTGVNARSIGFADQPVDCRACGKQNAVVVMQKVP